MSDYDGWTNYETQQAATWLKNAGYPWRCLVSDVDEVLTEDLEDELYELAYGECMQGLASEIYNDWSSRVNLSQIADRFNQDLTAMGE